MMKTLFLCCALYFSASLAMDVKILDSYYVPVEVVNVDGQDARALRSENKETRIEIFRGFKSGLAAGITTNAPGVSFRIQGKFTLKAMSIRETVKQVTKQLVNITKKEREIIEKCLAYGSIAKFLKFLSIRGGSVVTKYDKRKKLNMRISNELSKIITRDSQKWSGQACVQFQIQGTSVSFFTATHRAFVEVFALEVNGKTITVIEQTPNVRILDQNNNQSARVDDNDTVIIE